MTPSRERIELVVDGEVLEFYGNKLISEYDTVDSLMKDVKILSCMAALTDISVQRQREDNGSITYLMIELKEQKLPWEESISAYFDFADNICDIEIRLKTAVRTDGEIVANTIASSIINSKFALKMLDPDFEDEPPSEVFGYDGSHSWVVHLSVMPDATFDEFFRMRRRLSQEVFLPSGSITTPDVALKMVQNGQVGILLGYQESEWLEAKEIAYDFKRDSQQTWSVELAKDVAQFANSDIGGLLVLGLRTKRIDGVDTIDRITAFPPWKERVQSYRSIVKERIHPPISGLQLDAMAYGESSIVYAFVPPQPEENKPYLVSGAVIDGKFESLGITIVRRHGDGKIPITAREVHSMIVAGRALLRGAATQSNDSEPSESSDTAGHPPPLEP